jgi:hypothetical protein
LRSPVEPAGRYPGIPDQVRGQPGLRYASSGGSSISAICSRSSRMRSCQ